MVAAGPRAKAIDSVAGAGLAVGRGQRPLIGCGASRRSRADARSYRALRFHSGEGVVTAETIGNTLDTDSPAHQTRAPAHHGTKHAEPATFFADGLIH